MKLVLMMLLILRVVTVIYGFLHDFDISQCKCISQNSPCAKKGRRINFNFARMPSPCLPNLFLCCDGQLELLSPKGNSFSSKMKSFNSIVQGLKSDVESNKTGKTKQTKFHRPQNSKIPLLFQKNMKYQHQISENNSATNSKLNTKFSKISQRDFTAIRNLVPAILKGVAVNFTNNAFNLYQTDNSSSEKTPYFTNESSSNDMLKIDIPNENLPSGLKVQDLKGNKSIKNERHFPSSHFPPHIILDAKMNKNSGSTIYGKAVTKTYANINLKDAIILATKDVTENLNDYRNTTNSYNLKQNYSQNTVELNEMNDTKALGLLKDVTNISFSEAYSKSDKEIERNNNFELITISNIETRETPMNTEVIRLQSDTSSEGAVNLIDMLENVQFSNKPLPWDGEISSDTPLVKDFEYSSDTPLPEDVEYSSDAPLPEDVEYSSDAPLPEDVEYSSDAPLPEDVEYSSDAPLPEDVEYSSNTPLPEDVEYSSNTPLPEDVEYSSDTPLPEDAEYSSDTPLPEDVEYSSDTPLPEDVEYSSDAPLPEDVEYSSDAPLPENVKYTGDNTSLPKDVEFYNNTPMSEVVVLRGDRPLLEEFPRDGSLSEVIRHSDEMQLSEAASNTPLSEELVEEILIHTPLSENTFQGDAHSEEVAFWSDISLFEEHKPLSHEVVELSNATQLAKVVSHSRDVELDETSSTNATMSNDKSQFLDVHFESTTTMMNENVLYSISPEYENKTENISNPKNFSKSKLEIRTRAKTGEIINFDDVYFKPEDINEKSNRNKYSLIYIQSNINSSEVVPSVKPSIIPSPIAITNINTSESDQTRIVNSSQIEKKYLDRLLSKENGNSKTPLTNPNNLNEVTGNSSVPREELEDKSGRGNSTGILPITTGGSKINEDDNDNSILNWVFNIFN